MEEDVLGPRKQVLRRGYIRCSKCGRTYARVTPKHSGALRPEEARVEDVSLCPTCRDVVPTDKQVIEVEET